MEDATQYRKCPKCGKEIRADATLCGYCWTKSTPTAVTASSVEDGSQIATPPSRSDNDSSLGLALPEEAERDTSTRSTGGSYESHESRYPALHAVGSAYAFLGWLVIIGGILFGLFSVALASREGGFGAGAIAGIFSVLGGIVLGLPMLACRDVIRWMLDLQGHAKRSEELLGRMRAGR